MADTYGPVSSSAPEVSLTQKIELSISCRDLPRLDALSKSDPMVIVYLKQESTNQPYAEVGRTELIKNDHNPHFTTTIRLNYFFEEIQRLRFLVVDVDDAKKTINEFSGGKDVIGNIECTVGDLMGSRGTTIEKDIENKEKSGRFNGKIKVVGIDVSGSTSVRFRLSASNLDKKDFLGKSDPYVVIHRGDVTGQNFTAVHKTEYIKQNLNPTWNPFTLSSGTLCGGDPNLPIMFEVFDWDKDGGHDLIGIFKTTLNEMRNKKVFDIIEPSKKMKKKDYKNSGTLQILELTDVRNATFLEYVTGGTEINLIVGIDFTGSNGDPMTRESLHYRDPTGYPNQYQQAIRTVGDVVAPYDNDRWFPAYGFGGHLQSIGRTSHCFALNGNEQNPFCAGIDGVLQSYVDSFNWLQLSGPTNFAPILTNVCNIAQQSMNGDKYYILLMITDGAITDLNDTLSVIKRAAGLPISIIIVGVGNANFESMNVLDDDDGKLGFPRDVVQFVPFRNYKNVPIAKLAKDTLAEIPKQLVVYMNQRNIQPKPRLVYIPPPMQQQNMIPPNQ